MAQVMLKPVEVILECILYISNVHLLVLMNEQFVS